MKRSLLLLQIVRVLALAFVAYAAGWLMPPAAPQSLQPSWADQKQLDAWAMQITATPLPTSMGLRVNGTTLIDELGARFVVSGVNLEMYRDPGCQYVTEGQYPVRNAIASRMRGLGINAVRINYSQEYLFADPDNMVRLLDMMQALTDVGLYIMPTDHTYTGKPLTNHAAAFPAMQAITEGVRQRGMERWLVWNPYNEPGGADKDEITWAAWEAAQRSTLDFLRREVGFTGVVVLDGKYWASDYDTATYDRVLTYDAALLRSTPNVVFSNHWYPNHGTARPRQVMALAGRYPLLIGEVGQYNETPVNPAFVRTVLADALTAIPNGFNGVFAWIWGWCDSNKMVFDWLGGQVAYTGNDQLTPYGELVVNDYYRPLAVTPIAQLLTATPTPITATNTPITATPSVLPTNTRRPSRTPLSTTPAPTPDATLQPTGQRWRIEVKVVIEIAIVEVP